MNFVKDFEAKLESITKDIYTKTPRAKIQPKTIAKKLLHEMENNLSTTLSHTFAPNNYFIHLNRLDIDSIGPLTHFFTNELEFFLKEESKEKGLILVGSPEINFIPDSDIEPGHMEVKSSLSIKEDMLYRKGINEETRIISEEEALLLGLISSSPALMLKTETKHYVFPLLKEKTSIGRLRDNDIVLNSPEVSRRHAEINRKKGDFFIKDLNSTNGIVLNNKEIKKEKRLVNGDILILGTAELEFKNPQAEK
ncbi:MAG: DUF3662 domain-containing protein [Actinobacteria bacterium]|nr:DUF3662 domain-containing protein [Actinomycetota bacterium]